MQMEKLEMEQGYILNLVEIFFEQINVTGHEVRDDQEICLGMVFYLVQIIPQERCRTLLDKNY